MKGTYFKFLLIFRWTSILIFHICENVVQRLFYCLFNEERVLKFTNKIVSVKHYNNLLFIISTNKYIYI
jgi:hypothetical protein